MPGTRPAWRGSAASRWKICRITWTANGVSSSDIALLTRWVRQQGVLSLQVYRQGALVYDSALQQQDYDGLAGDELPSWETPYPVTFADGEAEILLEGSYAYRLYTYALVAELAAAFALFFGIVMAGIRRTIRYIRQLSGEIRILEGGGLDYKVTVQGSDELGQLARGLDDMRLAFQRQQQQEKALAQASQRMGDRDVPRPAHAADCHPAVHPAAAGSPLPDGGTAK